MYSFRFRYKRSAKDSTAESMDFYAFLVRSRMHFHCFKEYDIDPSGKKDKRDVFNIWPGFQARQLAAYDPEKIQLVQYIWKELWARGDEKIYLYILAWFRYLLAHPDVKLGVAMLVTGLEGAGKSVIPELFHEFIIGPHLAAVFDGVEGITEKHNTKKAGKRLWVLEEARSSKDQFIHLMDLMKRLITNKTITQNPKNRDIQEVENIGMMLILSNHQDCIQLSTADRRYAMIQCGNARVGPAHAAWWAAAQAQIKTQDTANHVYTWLLSLDASALPNPRIPLETDLRQRAMSVSKPPVRVFVEEKLEVYNALDAVQWCCTASGFYMEYQTWCKQNGHSNVLANNRFHGKVDEMEDLNIVYVKTNSGRYYRSRLGVQSAHADEAATRAALTDAEFAQLV